MAADGLFTWIDAVFNKKQPQGTPPVFMMHRFLASDPDMAQLARQLQLQVREPVLVFRIWQGSLPKGSRAPRLGYVAAKKPPAAEALVERMQEVIGERRGVVEQMIELVRETGRLEDLYFEFGVEPPETEAPKREAKGLLA